MSTREQAPFRLGDRVRGLSYVPPERRHRERPEEFEGVIVQIGSGYAGVDAERAFVWSRLADHTERQSLVRDTELLEARRGGGEPVSARRRLPRPEPDGMLAGVLLTAANLLGVGVGVASQVPAEYAIAVPDAPPTEDLSPASLLAKQ